MAHGAGRCQHRPLLAAVDRADREDSDVPEARVSRIKHKITDLRRRVISLKEMESWVASALDQQVSLTDPDACSMATSGKGTGIVGYNVQTVVDTKHHLIVAHEVTNLGHDRTQLANMGRQAKDATGGRAAGGVPAPRAQVPQKVCSTRSSGRGGAA